MKTRYAVLRTSKYFIVRCLFKFMRSCFVLLEIRSLFQIPLWKASFGGSCFFSIKNPNLGNIQIVFIAANVIFWISSSKKNLMAPFYGQGSTAQSLQNHYKVAVYFLLLSSKKFLVPIWSTSEGWKADSTLEPHRGFQHRIIGLWIQRLNQ